MVGLRVTYVASDVVLDDTLLLGDTASLGAGGDAKGASLCDRVWSNCGVG